jgi:predicted ATP-grasp superfamily ATP-dependent carboligase
MWLRSSRGYDTNNGAPHRVGDKKHSAIDQTNRTETQLIRSIEIIELDHVRVQEHLCGGSEVESVLLPVRLFLGGVPLKIRGEP